MTIKKHCKWMFVLSASETHSYSTTVSSQSSVSAKGSVKRLWFLHWEVQ